MGPRGSPPDLIFKNQAVNEKDKPPGQFVNDLLRTEFHKWVHPKKLSCRVLWDSFPFEQEIHVSLRQVVYIIVHACVRVHAHYTISTTHCALVFHRILEAVLDSVLTIDPGRHSHQISRDYGQNEMSRELF